MKCLTLAASALALITLIDATGHAQMHSATGATPFQGTMVRPRLNPSLSLSAPTNNPLQAQMRNDYATQLQQNQRALLQQNPSGLTRQELAVGHALNGFAPN
jgi:hypothetical protein